MSVRGIGDERAGSSDEDIRTAAASFGQAEKVAAESGTALRADGAGAELEAETAAAARVSLEHRCRCRGLWALIGCGRIFGVHAG